MPKTLHSTKHFKLVRELRPLIARLTHGDEIPTQKTLKEDFNVSQNTIELALTRLRREGVIERPAGKQRLVKAKISDPADYYIAIIRPDWPSMVIEGISQSIVNAGHEVNWTFDFISYRSQNGLDLDKAIGDNDAAVLMLTSETVPDHLRDAMTYTRKPLVLAQDIIPDIALNAVATDDRKNAALAVEHLASLGHRQIALLLPTLGTFTMQEAYKGWQSGMHQLGLTDLDALLIECHTKPFKHAIDVAYPKFKAWLKKNKNKATAVICGTLEMGLAAKRCIHEEGIKFPDDFSLVCFDAFSRMGEYQYPPLTSLEMDLSQYGKQVIKLLQHQFDSTLNQPQTQLFGGYLVKRQTTGPVPISVFQSQ